MVPSSLSLAHREREAPLTILYRLRKALRGVDGYDLVLLDCPPSVGTPTVNALVAADVALLVTEPARASIKGIVETRESRRRRRGGHEPAAAARRHRAQRHRQYEGAPLPRGRDRRDVRRARLVPGHPETRRHRRGVRREYPAAPLRHPEARTVAALYDALAARLLKETT